MSGFTDYKKRYSVSTTFGGGDGKGNQLGLEDDSSPSREGLGVIVLPTRKSNAAMTLRGTNERGEAALMMMPTELLDGFLSGLEAQGEMTKLLEELYYRGV